MRRSASHFRLSKPATRLLLSVFGTLLAWAVAGTQLSSTLHFALISHEICGEHGELTHGHEHADTHPEAHVHETAAVSASAHEDAHDHCGLLARPEEKVTLEPPAALLVVAPAATDVAQHPLRALVIVTQSTRLLSAPKTSPPV